MKSFINNLMSEILKLCYSKSFRIVAIIIIVAQSFLAYISAKQVLGVGLDAVPTATNGLIEAMPPIEYMGFDVILFGNIPMIVLGALFGAGEYKLHSLRTSMLSFGNKEKLFFSKSLAIALITMIMTFISSILTISITHYTFGSQGLKLLVFNSTVWKFIILSVVSLTLLTLLSYYIGFLFKTAVVPLLFLIIQAYNVGNILAEKISLCNYLPVCLSNHLIACSESSLSEHPIINILGLLIWVISFAAAGYILFKKSDLQGEY